MSIDDAKNYISKAIKSFETISLVVITGGEPFILGISFLEEIILFSKSFKLLTRIVSNGFWACSEEKTNKHLVRLKNAGLDELNLSTGDEHQEYVKLESISRAAIESVKLNITTVINVEAHLSSNFTADTLFKIPSFNEFFSKEENSDKLKIINGLWSDFKKGAKSLEFDKNSLKLIQESKKGCDSIFKIFSVFPDGQMAACCGLTIKKIKELKLGNLNCYSARFLYELQYMNFINFMVENRRTICNI